jgi:deoxyribodipyrimidine photo-lyase
VKDLGIDWRGGKGYFAERLNDFDFCASNGGSEWAAPTGCDAQPSFRIFDPVTEAEQFDADGLFIKCYLPQLANVPPKWVHAPWLAPNSWRHSDDAGKRLSVVNHPEARQRTLVRFGN